VSNKKDEAQSPFETWAEAKKKQKNPKQCFHIPAGGDNVIPVTPKDGKWFSLEELQGYVGGNVELAVLRDGRDLWLNEEGKLIGLEFNPLATMLWQDTFGSSDVIVGDVIITNRKDTE
jgi:hypothetical protein